MRMLVASVVYTTLNPQDGYAVRAILPRHEWLGLLATGQENDLRSSLSFVYHLRQSYEIL